MFIKCFFAPYRKKKVWQDVALPLKACGYEDRDGEMCKTRIHTLTSAYRDYLDKRRNTTGTAPAKKPPRFNELDMVLSDRPTTLPYFLTSSLGTITEILTTSTGSTTGIEKTNADSGNSDVEDYLQSTLDVDDKIMNSIHIDMATSFSPNTTPVSANKQDGTFYFNKSKKKKSSSDVMFKKLDTSIHLFMASQADCDKEFLEKFFERSNKCNEEGNMVVIKVRQSGDSYFIEIELAPSDLTFQNLTDTIKKELLIVEDSRSLLTKLPNVLIRNDKDVKRLSTRIEVKFLVISEE